MRLEGVKCKLLDIELIFTFQRNKIYSQPLKSQLHFHICEYGRGFIGVCEITLLQTIDVGTKVMVSVTLSSLPGSSTSYVMAMGGLDSQVHLYVGTATGQVRTSFVFPVSFFHK